MKICPHCRELNIDSDRYCSRCRRKLDDDIVQIHDVSKKKKGRGTAITVILIIAVIAAITMAFVRPDFFQDDSKRSFGSGFARMIPKR